MSETTVEYAIRWGVDGSLEPCFDRASAEHLIRTYPAWDGSLLSRLVEHGEWVATA